MKDVILEYFKDNYTITIPALVVLLEDKYGDNLPIIKIEREIVPMLSKHDDFRKLSHGDTFSELLLTRNQAVITACSISSDYLVDFVNINVAKANGWDSLVTELEKHGDNPSATSL